MVDDIDPEARGYAGADPYAALPKGTTGRPQVTINAQPIKVKAKDGTIHNFPANAPHDQIEKIMNDYDESRRDKSTTLGEVGTGMMDPVEGGGELLSDLLPKQVNRALIAANNKMADYSMGLIRKLPTEEQGGKVAQMRQREAAIQANRGANTSTDYARMAGDILSPINWLGVGLGKLVAPTEALVRGSGWPTLARIGSAMEQGEIAGLTSAATQPTTSENRGQEKAIQMGEGAVAGGVLGGAFATAGRVAQHLINTFGADALKDPDIRAVVDAIKRDEKGGGMTAAEILQKIKKSPQRQPLTMTDVGGENVQALAGSSTRPQGPGRQFARNFLQKRDQQAAKRLASATARFLKGGPTAFRTTQLLLDLRSATAKPAYDAAFALEGVWSPRLQQFLEDPLFKKKAMNAGYELERLQALARGEPLNTSQLGVDLDTEGNIKMLDVPNMRILDIGKQGLDALIAAERDPNTGRLSKMGMAMNAARKAYVAEMDSLDTKGIYSKARAQWAGYSSSMDAITLGRNIFNMSPEEISSEIGQLSDLNMEFYRTGVADMLQERLAKTALNGDEAKKLINSDWMRKQLRPAFKSTQAFNKFVDAVSSERQMFEAKQKMMGGSPTAERTGDDKFGLMDRPEWKIGEKFMTQGLVSAAAQTYRMLHDLAFKPSPELNDKIAKILFATKLPSQVEQMILAGSKSRPAAPPSKAAETMQQMGIGMTPAATVDLTKERAPQ